ncbi:high affinity cGMP-specific 3',5'-cyclic phosphodiesterase 9A [Ischnura elegans]|uniref:high affinity cGMP-specific 3',5'-cyclic phosphodiesterase 9A n=1 Tax=Ischnura elegans TaxID=197161 RepID=UPI001ED88EE7|nr:high affinity cGMP-specific 3',5'-cyclic phosphodiesterase 9A [Ischnura elegans]
MLLKGKEDLLRRPMESCLVCHVRPRNSTLNFGALEAWFRRESSGRSHVTSTANGKRHPSSSSSCDSISPAGGGNDLAGGAAADRRVEALVQESVVCGGASSGGVWGAEQGEGGGAGGEGEEGGKEPDEEEVVAVEFSEDITTEELKALLRNAARAGPADVVKVFDREGRILPLFGKLLPSNGPDRPYSLRVIVSTAASARNCKGTSHPEAPTGLLIPRNYDMVRDAIGFDLGGVERRLEHLEKHICSDSGEVPVILKELREEMEALRARLQNPDALALRKSSQENATSNTVSSGGKRKKRVMGKHQPYGRRDPEAARQVYLRFMEISEGSACQGVRHWLRQASFESDSWSDEELLLLLQHMYLDLGLPSHFGITMPVLRRFLFAVYDNYNDVPFHNFRHCFCVAQMMYAMICKAQLMPRIGDLEAFILITSCICHDLDHPGYNNIYQINARTELALRYNDISPLENHHCSVAFRILEEDPDCDIFANLSPTDYKRVREGVIRCILATDMARHNEILAQFREITPTFDYANPAHINLLSMVLIKVADISNEARPMNVAEPWLDRLLQEFFSQSDAEKMEGLPVTPFMDRDKVTKPSSQCSFIGYVVLPLFEALGDLLPELQDLIITPVREALDYYRRLNEASKEERHRRSMDAASGGGRSSKGDIGTSSEDGSGPALLDPHVPSVHHSGGHLLTKSGSAHSMRSKRSLQWMRSHSHSHSRSYDGGGDYDAAVHSGVGEKARSSDGTVEESLGEMLESQNRAINEERDEDDSDEEDEDEEGEETVTEVEVSEKTLKFKISTEGASTVVPPSGGRKRRESRVESRARTEWESEMAAQGGEDGASLAASSRARATQDVPQAEPVPVTDQEESEGDAGSQPGRPKRNHSIMSRLWHFTERLSLGGGGSEGHGKRMAQGIPSPPGTPPRPHSDCSGTTRGRASPLAMQRKSASLGREGHGGRVCRGWRSLLVSSKGGGQSSPAPDDIDPADPTKPFLTPGSPEELGNGTAGASPSAVSSASSSSAHSSRKKKGKGHECEVEEEVTSEGSLARSLDSMLQRDHSKWWQHQRVGRSGGPSPSSKQRGFFLFSSARSRGEKGLGGRGAVSEAKGGVTGGSSKNPPLLGGSIRRRKLSSGGQKSSGQGKVTVPLGDGVACDSAN